MQPGSPKVDILRWGSIEVEGHGRFKDVKLWPGGAREWDWRETGTRHCPGIQVADVLELVDQGATHVVLSRGQWRFLKVMRDTIRQLASEGITVHEDETAAAVAEYNRLAAAGVAMGALLHSTC